ncbi:MAG TPA: hypothetical protein VGM90_38335 [Kofleriaceae bacterium]|jgi:hypothetical protein
MRSAAFLMILAACGGPSTAPKTPAPAPTTPTATPTTSPAAPAAVTVQQVCDRVEELQHEHCGEFGSSLVITPLQCNQLFTEKASADDEAFREKAKACIMKPDCAQVSTCIAATEEDPPPTEFRACGTGGESPVGVTPAEYAQRNGSTAKRYSDVTSTKAAPVERCGVGNANQWLATLSCGDGSHPITNGPTAESFRAGNVGEGGRCKSIIDDYKVVCPEGTSEIFIDAYVCPK